MGSQVTLHNVHEHAAVLHMRLLRRQTMLRSVDCDLGRCHCTLSVHISYSLPQCTLAAQPNTLLLLIARNCFLASRGERMCAAAVQTMLFFTRKNLATMASALSRWSSCVQQRKAKVRPKYLTEKRGATMYAAHCH